MKTRIFLFLTIVLSGFFLFPNLSFGATRTISDAGGNWNATGAWVEGAVPVNGDDVVATATSGNLVVNVATAYLNSFDLNGYTGTLSGSSAIYVRPANGTTVTVRFAGTFTWTNYIYMDTVATGDSGTTINFYSGGKTNTVLVGSGIAGPITINQMDNLTTTGVYGWQLASGTWNTNNYNITTSQLRFNGSGTKVFNAGSSTLAFTVSNPDSGAWLYYTGSNLTFNAGTSTINITSAGNLIFYGGGLTFYNITRTGTAVGTDGIRFSGNLTIATGGTLTLNGNGGNGTTTNYRLLVSTSTIGTQSTITFTDAINVGTNLVSQYADFRDIAFNAAADLSAITGGSGDCGGNTNITFTTADTETWGGSASSWATVANWTGGVVNRVPLPQDTVALTGTGTVTINQTRLGKDISTNAATPITLANAVTSYGSLNLSNAGTFSGNYTWTFESQARTGNITITSNGKYFAAATFQPYGATAILADAFQSGSAGAGNLTLSAGTLDAGTNNVSITAGAFSATAGTVKLGTGTLTLADASTWAAAVGVTLLGNANINVASGRILYIVGVITDGASSYSISKTGAGTLKLYGNNTFDGGLTIKAGTLYLTSSANAAGTGTITLGDTSGSTAVTLTGDGLTFTNAIALSDIASYTGVIKIMAGDSNCTFSGNITGTNDLTLDVVTTKTLFLSGSVNPTGTITNSSAAGTAVVTISGVIDTNVTGIIQNSTTSALTLSNASNTFTGTITNSAGTLNITQNNTFSTLTLAGDSTTNITAGKTVTLTNLVSTGTSGHLAILKSSSAGSAASLTTASAQIATDYLSVQDSTPVQTNTWFAGANGSLVSNYGNWGTVPDSTPPTQSAWSPTNNSAITTATPTITLTLNENGDCRLSLLDDSYDLASDDTDCTGDGTTSITCVAPDLGADGAKNVYIACQDTLLNKDTNATNTDLTFNKITTTGTARYWIAASTQNWSSTTGCGGTTCWSTTSGGTGGASVPTTTDDAIFDGVRNGNCTIDTTVSVKGMFLAGYTGEVSQGSNAITVGADDYYQATGTFTGGSVAITFSYGADYYLSGGTFTSTSGNLTIGGLGDMTISGGTFDPSTGTVIFTSDASTLNVATTETFNNFQLNKGNGQELTIATGDTVVVEGATTLTNGKLGYGTGILNAKGSISVASTFDGGASNALLIDGSGDQSFVVASGTILPGINLNNANTTVSFDAGVNISFGSYGDLTIQAGTFISTTGTLTLPNGDFTHTAGGTFDSNGGTVAFTGNDHVTVNVAASENFYGFTLDKSEGNFTISSGDTLVVNGTLTLTNGTVYTGTVNAKGPVLVASTFDGGTAAVQMTSTTQDQALTIADGGVMPTGLLTIDKAGRTATITGTTSAAKPLHNIALTAGTLTFNPGTYYIDDADTISVASGATLNFTGTGYGAGLVTLRSDTTAAWDLTKTGAVNAVWTDVQYSNCSNSASPVIATNSINSLNNTNWIFSAPGGARRIMMVN